MSHRLPEKGLWHVSDRHRTEAAPFDLIKLDLRDRGAGVVRARNLETRLRRIRLTGEASFAARYDIRGHTGTIEGRLRPDGSLAISLSGTVTGTFLARPVEPVAGKAPALRALAGAVDRLWPSEAPALAL